MFTTDILLLFVLSAITILGFMISINAHGNVRLIFSYLLAVVLLLGNVFAVVQYVNNGAEQQRQLALAQVQKLQEEKLRAEEALHSQQELSAQERVQATEATAISSLISAATTIATKVRSANIHEPGVDLDALIGRASSLLAGALSVKADFDKTTFSSQTYTAELPLLRDGIDQTIEACRYYTLYYKSDDPSQEEQRERAMRGRASTALATLTKISANIAAK